MSFKRFLLSIVIVTLLSLQIYISSLTNNQVPKLGLVPEVPTLTALKISAMGDDEFYFRLMGLQIQNAGDTFGRFTALKDYDYKTLKNWLVLLDNLDHRSNLLPALASYYYSNTQNIEDNIYLVEYLDQNFDYDPNLKWWWLTQATTLAKYKLKDNNLALKLALKMNKVTYNIPKWARQLPAIFYADMGEPELALNIIEDLIKRHDDYSEGDINYMNYFIKERLAILNNNVYEHHDVTPGLGIQLP